MNKREPLMTETYFDDYIAFIKDNIQEVVDGMPRYVDKAGALFDLWRYRLSFLYTRYSRGYSVETLRDDFLAVLDAWEKQRVEDTQRLYDNSFKNEMTDYVESIGLVSQAYLLNLDKDVMQRLLACIGNEGQDLLFERLVGRIAPDIVRHPAKKLLYPKAYQPLYDALDAQAEQQAVLLREFLQNWYKRIKAVGWHDAHKGPEGGGFKGYWCWEAAGVAHAFNIDDTSFRDLPYYPKDLADYARAKA